MVVAKELIQKNVTGLSDDQVNALEKLFDNAINSRVSEIYQTIDKNIFDVTGNPKPGGVKTYDHLVAELQRQKKAIEDATGAGGEDLKKAQQELATANARIKELEDSKGDETIVTGLRQQIQDSTDKYTQLEKLYNDDKAKWAKDLHLTNVNNEFASARGQLKFREDLGDGSDELIKMSIANAERTLLQEYTTDFIDDGKGGKVMVFRKDNVIQNNPDNNLSPYTALEMLTGKLTGLLAKKVVQPGTGTKPNDVKKPGGNTKLSQLESFVPTATTQAEAMTQIAQHLIDNGVPQNHPDHQPTVDKIVDANKVLEMDVR